MGGTLPLICKFWVRQRYQLRSEIGLLYGTNTAGAVLGALLTGYFLIGRLGLTQSTALAIVLNMVVMLLVLVVIRTWGGGVQVKTPETAPVLVVKDPTRPAEMVVSRFEFRLILILFALSGFTSLAYEVCWTRFFALVLGNTSYGLSAVLVSFLIGISLGSWLAVRSSSRRTSGASIFVRVQVLIALSTLLLHLVVALVPSLVAGLFTAYGLSFWLLQAMQLIFIVYFLLVPATCYGYLFPVVADMIVTRLERLGQGIGHLYLVNAIGATAGPLVMTFVLIPWVGLDWSLSILVLTNLALAGPMVGLIRTGAAERTRLLFLLFLSTLVCAICVSVFSPTAVRSILEERVPPGWLIKDIVEEMEATVAIARGPDPKGKIVTRFYINGNPSASGLEGPLQLERFESLLPLLLHPQPKSLLVIGFGTGITAGAARDFPLDTIDAVEIIGSIPGLARTFALENRNILADPRLTLYIEDGRQFLKRTNKKYDVITTGPQHPTQAGSVHLYTREYFRDCAARLEENGTMAQWLPLYQLYAADIVKVLLTMKDVFPHLSVWAFNHDLIVLGKKTNSPLPFSSLRKHWKEGPLASLLRETGLHIPLSLVALYVTTDVDSLHPGHRHADLLVSDDLPSIEFSSLAAINQDTVPDNLTMVSTMLEEPTQGITAYLDWSGQDRLLAEKADLILQQRRTYFAARILHQQGLFSESQPLYFSVLNTFPYWPNLMRDLHATSRSLRMVGQVPK